MVQHHLSWKYIIIGGGNACGYLCREMVACGLQSRELLVITAEEQLPYERPALSKGFMKPQNPPRLPDGFETCAGDGGLKQTEAWPVVVPTRDIARLRGRAHTRGDARVGRRPFS